MHLNDYRIQPEMKPQQIVVLLHGYGANGKDLLGLGHEWQATLPACVFVSPDAPHQCEMGNAGYQWFTLQNPDMKARVKELLAVAPVIDEYLDSLLKQYELPANKLALVGFSQGSMISLHVAPRRHHQLAGVLAYSGALLDHQTLHKQKRSAPPICLVHGTDDDVVPANASMHAQGVLNLEHIPTELHMLQNLPHGINEEGIRIGEAFLQRVLA